MKVGHYSLDSSSFHCLNADKPLSEKQLQRFIRLNQNNNQKPLSKLDPKLLLSVYKPAILENLEIASRSPSRVLSDLFWSDLNWSWIKQNLGKLDVIDLGCGKGGYFEFWKNASKGAIDSYHGVDVQKRENWKPISELSRNAKFFEMQATDIPESMIDESTVLFSQSALEHIEDDLRFFRKISKFIRKRTSPFLQIHLIPSPICLEKYRFHGVRQYSPRTVSKISRLFTNSNCELVSMGDKHLNNVHLKYITKPVFELGEDWRETRKEAFEAEFKKALVKDIELGEPTEPSFYALIIAHRMEADPILNNRY